MKNVLFLCLSLLTGIVEAQKIDGIGMLRINKTKISIIDSLKSSGYTLTSLPSSSDLFSSKDPFASRGLSSELSNINTIIEADQYYAYPVAKNQRVFDISTLTISGIELKNLSLCFFRDTLIGITIDSPTEDFLNAIKIKYGPGTIKSKTKKVICQSKVAGNYDLIEEDFTTTYRDDVINAYSYLSKYYDDHCNKKFFEMFQIAHVKKTKLIDALQKNEQKAKEDQDKKELKAKLNDF